MATAERRPRLAAGFRLLNHAALAALGIACAGCGGGPFDIVPVQGTVVYEDGEPVPCDGCHLKFVPEIESPDGKSFPRVATAILGPDGAFDAATTHKYEDGLARGKHRVYFQLRGAGAPVPEEYLNSKTTPLVVDVAQSRTLQIRVPRP